MVSEALNPDTRQTVGDWANEINFLGAHSGTCMRATAKNKVSGEFSFSFSIPIDATIDGIEILYHCADDDDAHTIELNDGVAWWGQATTKDGSRTACNCVDKTLGGAVDLWGGTWTPAHINSTDFRIRVTSTQAGKAGAEWEGDYCEVTIYYTEAPPNGNGDGNGIKGGGAKTDFWW